MPKGRNIKGLDKSAKKQHTDIAGMSQDMTRRYVGATMEHPAAFLQDTQV
jgi:hypothetical protein